MSDPFTIATKHWHRLHDSRIQCDVCPRACKLHEDSVACVSSAADLTIK